MKVLVVLSIFTACVTAAGAAAASCAGADEFFARHNASADDSDEPGGVCGGQCCRRGGEMKLRSMLRKTAEQRLSSATKPITELLLATRRTLQEHLIALSYQSQNKTSVLFSQLYRGQAMRTHAPLSALYDDIRILIKPGSDDDLGSPPPKDMRESTKKFFRDVFPVAYQNVLRLDSKQFTPEYEECLRDVYDPVQPFGDVPQRLGASMSRSLEAARALLQVISVGANALITSELVLSGADEECDNKLLRMGGCSRCKGHDISPCRNYCLNVARGCIGSLVVELDAPWAGYVEGVERLARADADAELRGLDARISEAIMHALENHVILEKKLRLECGSPSTIDLKNSTSPRTTPGATRRDALRAPPPDTELLQFAATLASSKKLFASLSDRLCDEPDFANEGNDRCWNGETIGEYTKALVASASVSDQKYNPEITKTSIQDSRVAALGDRLRQARQLLVSHWGSVPAAESFMQGDEAGDEGSGSGRSYTDDDATYDAEGSGEGSGDEFVGSRREDEDTTYSSPPLPTSSASYTTLSISVIASSIFFTLT